jgi:CDP-glucose 4,6-dehydratase
VKNEASNEIRLQYLSAEKAKKAFDWKPLYSLDESLEKTIAWYRAHLTGAST